MELYEIVAEENTVKPEDTQAVQAEWLKKRMLERRRLVTSLEKQPLTHILICISAKKMFQKICSIYERDTEKQKYLLLQEFFNYKYQRGQDIAAHVSTIKHGVQIESFKHGYR